MQVYATAPKYIQSRNILLQVMNITIAFKMVENDWKNLLWLHHNNSSGIIVVRLYSAHQW